MIMPLRGRPASMQVRRVLVGRGCAATGHDPATTPCHPGGVSNEAGAPANVAVIGGGISGLAAAWFLRQGLGQDARIVVYEKKSAIGGHLRVSDVAGVPVDEGAESLLARRPEAVELAQAVGLGDDVVHPAGVGAALWTRDQLTALPAGTVMGVPERPEATGGVLDEAEIARAVADAHEPGMPIVLDRLTSTQLWMMRCGASQ